MKPAFFQHFSFALALIVPLFLITPTTAPRAQQTLGIAAVINEEVISLYDLASRINLVLATSGQQNTAENRKRHTRQVLNQLINEKLQLQEAERIGIKISDKELDRAFNNVAGGSKMTPQQLNQFLERLGADREMMIDQLRAQIAWGRTVNRIYRSQLTIGNEEVDEIVDEIKKSKGKPEYLIAEIYLPIDRPENTEKIRDNANQVVSQLKSGAQFSALARNFSQSATAAVGGDLGWIRQGQLAAELDQAINAMADGSISMPVRTVSGFHIIFKRKSRTGRGLISEDEQVDLYQVFLPLPPAASEAGVKAGLDAAAKLTAAAAGCSEMAAIGKQSGSELSGGLGKMKVSSLPPHTRDLIQDLVIGKASRPMRSGDGVIVLMICQRLGKKSLAEIRSKIESSLLNERLEILARRHLRDLRRAAFLDVRI